MDELGWESCDIILVTGDAYRPSELRHGADRPAPRRRTASASASWRSRLALRRRVPGLSTPGLMWGVTGGNMDPWSTATRATAASAPMTPTPRTAKRACVRIAQCRSTPSLPRGLRRRTAFIIGGIEASLRRIAHYDYWSDRVRRSFAHRFERRICLSTATPSARSSSWPTPRRRYADQADPRSARHRLHPEYAERLDRTRLDHIDKPAASSPGLIPTRWRPSAPPPRAPLWSPPPRRRWSAQPAQEDRAHQVIRMPKL